MCLSSVPSSDTCNSNKKTDQLERKKNGEKYRDFILFYTFITHMTVFICCKSIIITANDHKSKKKKRKSEKKGLRETTEYLSREITK